MSQRVESRSKSLEKEIGAGSSFKIMGTAFVPILDNREDEYLTRVGLRDPVEKNDPVEENPIFLKH
jgi:hypothetical protein